LNVDAKADRGAFELAFRWLIKCFISIFSGLGGRGRGRGRCRGRGRSFPCADSNSRTMDKTRKRLQLEIAHEEEDKVRRKLPPFPGTGKKYNRHNFLQMCGDSRSGTCAKHS
jgi:hypothetical protein